MAKSKRSDNLHLGSRERQIMDAVYQLEEASVAEVLAVIPDPPSYSAVRTMIRLLESKGLLRHRRDGLRYVYRPTRAKDSAKRSAIKHLKDVFFGGSIADAVAALLDEAGDHLSAEELDRLEKLINDKRD